MLASAGLGAPLIEKIVAAGPKKAPRLLRKAVFARSVFTRAAPPPPSQLISRRPPGRGPGALALFGAPTAPRNAFTVSRISAGGGPAAPENTRAAAAPPRPPPPPAGPAPGPARRLRARGDGQAHSSAGNTSTPHPLPLRA